VRAYVVGSSLVALLTVIAGLAGDHDSMPRHAGYVVAHVRAGRSLELRASPGGRSLLRVGDRTEFGTRRALGVTARRGGWLAVTDARLGNGQRGWLRASDPRVELTRTEVALHADISRRKLTLERDGRTVREARVAVGAPSSPTPAGRFAITDKLRGPNYSASYGCCILAMSGSQPRTPAGWRGGSRLAIHGTTSSETIGRASSAGCLRTDNRSLRTLMREVPVGAPVFIHR
jgi:lipoprotein-anchoring transpeptidase ErfK/SrfK